MKRAMLAALMMMSLAGCQDAVGAVVSTTIDVATAVLTNPVVAPVVETGLEVTTQVAVGVVVIAGETLDAVAGGDCTSSVDSYANSDCEAACDTAKRDYGDSSEEANAACPEFAR